MALIKKETVAQFADIASEWLEDGSNFKDGLPRNLSDIESGADAWLVAHRSGILEICYGNTAKDLPGIEGCHDTHIKTALEKIFPNAIFKDRYDY